MCKVQDMDIYEVYPYKEKLNTPSGKVEIYSEELKNMGIIQSLHI